MSTLPLLPTDFPVGGDIYIGPCFFFSSRSSFSASIRGFSPSFTTTSALAILIRSVLGVPLLLEFDIVGVPERDTPELGEVVPPDELLIFDDEFCPRACISFSFRAGVFSNSFVKSTFIMVCVGTFGESASKPPWK